MESKAIGYLPILYQLVSNTLMPNTGILYLDFWSAVDSITNSNKVGNLIYYVLENVVFYFVSSSDRRI